MGYMIEQLLGECDTLKRPPQPVKNSFFDTFLMD